MWFAGVILVCGSCLPVSLGNPSLSLGAQWPRAPVWAGRAHAEAQEPPALFCSCLLSLDTVMASWSLQPPVMAAWAPAGGREGQLNSTLGGYETASQSTWEPRPQEPQAELLGGSAEGPRLVTGWILLVRDESRSPPAAPGTGGWGRELVLQELRAGTRPPQGPGVLAGEARFCTRPALLRGAAVFEMKPRGDRIRQAGEAPFWVPLAPRGAGRRCRQASSQPPTMHSDAPQLQAPHPYGLQGRFCTRVVSRDPLPPQSAPNPGTSMPMTGNRHKFSPSYGNWLEMHQRHGRHCCGPAPRTEDVRKEGCKPPGARPAPPSEQSSLAASV